MTQSAIGKIKASRVNNLDAATYVGPDGQIWYDVNTGVLRLGDNVTPGGTIIGGGSGNANPGGPTQSVQFNNGGVFGGTSGLTFNSTSNVLSTSGNVVSGNVLAGAYFFANGAPFISGSSYSNANVIALGQSGNWAGNIIPQGNNQFSLGNLTNQWAELFVSNSTIWINGVPLSSINVGNTTALTYNNAPIVTSGPNAAPISTNITTSANVSANTLIGNTITAQSANIGNVVLSLNNITVPGYVSAGGNIRGSNVYGTYLHGCGANITGVIGSAGNHIVCGSSQVAVSSCAVTFNIAGCNVGYVCGSRFLGKVVFGAQAGVNSTCNYNSVAIGTFAGQTNQCQCAVAVGSQAGNHCQGQSAVAIGGFSGQCHQGQYAVAIGHSAGQTNQGNNSVAIGLMAGSANQHTNSIIINAVGCSPLNASNPGFYVAPVRCATTAGGSPTGVGYCVTTKEIVYGLAGGGGSYGNSNVTTLLSSGTVSTNILTTANVSATGNVYGNNISKLTSNVANLTTSLAGTNSNVANNTSNISILQTAVISLTGNVYNDANVTSLLASGNISTNIQTTAIVIGSTLTGNTVTGNLISASGNVSGGNLISLGNVFATGNVTANNFIGNGSHLTGVPPSLVLVTSNIANLQAGLALNVAAVYGNSQYPGGIFTLYQSASPRPTLGVTNNWAVTGTSSKNAYTNYANNIINSSNVSMTLSISSPATFSVQSSDNIIIGSTVITGTNLTGLGITGTGGTYTIPSALVGNATEIATSSSVQVNLTTSAGGPINALGTTLTTVAPIPFSLSNITASFANATITPGLGNSQPVSYDVTLGSGTVLSGNIVISGAANLTTNVGTVLVGNTANIDSTAGNFIVTANYFGTGLYGAGNSVATANVSLAKVVETTPLFIKVTTDDSNPNFVPTDTNFGTNWVPGPGLPGNAQGITTNQYGNVTDYYWLAIPDADFWSYPVGVNPVTPGPDLYYNYILTGLGVVNSSYNQAWGNGTASFGGAGGTITIGTVPYVALGFTDFSNVQTGTSNPPNLFMWISTSDNS